ncbi:hypothetical protein SNK03_001734 [Fusarium graminearum]|uniref:Uncharacterized protein n=1 Tax=Gibberella zeae TaxID=5518 RepID=A0A4U9EVL7_GIBZA|nr:unnamed protein product [Fusarium graminearum]CAF3479825.1 unnamed protein product [Fusarium graminearum]CAF3599541.1 unnamed protein product [Fusarium graminearum]CAG1963146.1 unnamed protein product [Fusarium graminearum]CAG1981003.1 unnamed protein product [Fusarium graminearum]
MVFWNKTIIAHFQHHNPTNRPVNSSGGMRKGATCKGRMQPGEGLKNASLPALERMCGLVPTQTARKRGNETATARRAIASHCICGRRWEEKHLTRDVETWDALVRHKRYRVYDMFACHWI